MTNEAPTELNLDIAGMSCSGCCNRLTKALTKLGVTIKSVSVGKAIVDVEKSVSPAEVAAVVAALGFTVTAMNAKTP